MSQTLLSWADKIGIPHVVKCDAIVGLQDTRTSTPTQHPIESGSTISDHVIQNPNQLILEIRQSNTPILEDANWSRRPLQLKEPKNAFKPQGLFLLHSAAGAVISKVVGGLKPTKKPYILQSFLDKDLIVELHDKLIEVRNNAYSCEITRYGRTYTDYILVSVEYERNGNGMGGLGKFRLEFETVQTVETAVTKLPNPSKLAAKAKTSRGLQPSKTAGGSSSDVLRPGSLPYDAVFGKTGAGAAFAGGIR